MAHNDFISSPSRFQNVDNYSVKTADVKRTVPLFDNSPLNSARFFNLDPYPSQIQKIKEQSQQDQTFDNVQTFLQHGLTGLQKDTIDQEIATSIKRMLSMVNLQVLSNITINQQQNAEKQSAGFITQVPDDQSEVENSPVKNENHVKDYILKEKAKKDLKQFIRLHPQFQKQVKEKEPEQVLKTIQVTRKKAEKMFEVSLQKRGASQVSIKSPQTRAQITVLKKDLVSISDKQVLQPSKQNIISRAQIARRSVSRNISESGQSQKFLQQRPLEILRNRDKQSMSLGVSQIAIPVRPNSIITKEQFKTDRFLAITNVSASEIKTEEDKKRKLWRIEREKRQEIIVLENDKRRRQQEMEDQFEKQRQELEEQQKNIARLKNLENLHNQRTNQRERLIGIQQSEAKIKRKYIYQSIEEDYQQNVILPQIEVRKKSLEDFAIKGFRFKLEDVIQHASEYEQNKQKIDEERIQRNKEWRNQIKEREKQLGIEHQEGQTKREKPMNRYKSELLLELHKNPEPLSYQPIKKKDLKPTETELRLKQEEDHKLLASHAKAYGDIIRQTHKPKVSEKKQLELHILHEKRKSKRRQSQEPLDYLNEIRDKRLSYQTVQNDDYIDSSLPQINDRSQSQQDSYSHKKNKYSHNTNVSKQNKPNQIQQNVMRGNKNELIEELSDVKHYLNNVQFKINHTKTRLDKILEGDSKL